MLFLHFRICSSIVRSRSRRIITVMRALANCLVQQPMATAMAMALWATHTPSPSTYISTMARPSSSRQTTATTTIYTCHTTIWMEWLQHLQRRQRVGVSLTTRIYAAPSRVIDALPPMGVIRLTQLQCYREVRSFYISPFRCWVYLRNSLLAPRLIY